MLPFLGLDYRVASQKLSVPDGRTDPNYKKRTYIHGHLYICFANKNAEN